MSFFPLRLRPDDVLTAEAVADMAKDANTDKERFYSKHNAGSREGSHSDADRMVHPISVFRVNLSGDIPNHSSLESRLDFSFGLLEAPTWHRKWEIPAIQEHPFVRVLKWRVPSGYKQICARANFSINLGPRVPFAAAYNPMTYCERDAGYLCFEWSNGGGFELTDITHVTVVVFGTRPKP